jgi:ATP-dependent Clp protease ATP-binding subunit ClpA
MSTTNTSSTTSNFNNNTEKNRPTSISIPPTSQQHPKQPNEMNNKQNSQKVTSKRKLDNSQPPTKKQRSTGNDATATAAGVSGAAGGVGDGDDGGAAGGDGENVSSTTIHTPSKDAVAINYQVDVDNKQDIDETSTRDQDNGVERRNDIDDVADNNADEFESDHNTQETKQELHGDDSSQLYAPITNPKKIFKQHVIGDSEDGEDDEDSEDDEDREDSEYAYAIKPHQSKIKPQFSNTSRAKTKQQSKYSTSKLSQTLSSLKKHKQEIFENLNSVVVHQCEAITKLTDVVIKIENGCLHLDKYCLYGPTSVGKTSLIRAFVDVLKEEDLIQPNLDLVYKEINCRNVTRAEDVKRIRNDVKKFLSIAKSYSCVILFFDEIQSANNSLIAQFATLFDEGKLDGITIPHLIIFTGTNFGAEYTTAACRGSSNDMKLKAQRDVRGKILNSLCKTDQSLINRFGPFIPMYGYGDKEKKDVIKKAAYAVINEVIRFECCVCDSLFDYLLSQWKGVTSLRSLKEGFKMILQAAVADAQLLKCTQCVIKVKRTKKNECFLRLVCKVRTEKGVVAIRKPLYDGEWSDEVSGEVSCYLLLINMLLIQMRFDIFIPRCLFVVW